MLIWSQAQAFLCMWLLSAFVESLLRFFWSLQCFHLYIYMLQMVFQSALPHSMTAWARRRRAASTSSLTWHPTSSQGWSSLCSVRWGWGRESCHVATLAKISSKNVLLVSDAVLILPPCWLTNSCAQMLMCPFPRCLASVQQNTQPVLGPQAYT